MKNGSIDHIVGRTRFNCLWQMFIKLSD